MSEERRRVKDRRISPAVGEFAIQETHRLRTVNAELLAALQNTLVSLRVCTLPAGVNVASNEQLLRITADGTIAAIAKAQP